MPTPQRLNNLSLRILENGLTKETVDTFKLPVDNNLRKSTDRVLCPKDYDRLYNLVVNVTGIELCTSADKNYIKIKSLFREYPVFTAEILTAVTDLMSDTERKSSLRQNAHVFINKPVFTVST
jgi:hypothetical protein